MWTNEQPMSLDDMHHLNMVLAKGLRPADNPQDQALVINAMHLYRAMGRNFPWEDMSQTTKQKWINAYQRELKRSWGPFEIVPFSQVV